MADRVPARLTRSEGRRFGVTVGSVFLLIAAVMWWRAQGSWLLLLTAPSSWQTRHIVASSLLAIGAGLLLAGLAVPTRLGGLQRAWMGLAHALSRVTTPIIMAVIYFLVIAPIGLGMRVLGRQPLETRATKPSVWHSRSRRKGDLRRQF